MVDMIEIGDNITLHHGDCADVLGTLPENSIDAIVTDPPAGISFMGKEWDHHKGGRAEWVAWLASIMTEATRALKPGGHALVWALPRTSHWTATALEDAGLEIRDVITHHFATGFPKALDVSRALDAQAGAEREVVGVGRRHGGGVVGAASSYELPPTSPPITAPATLDAQKWDGWKTALKPATEHWILCRKPITGTVAANVVQHGTGALNIDGCRIATEGDSPSVARRESARKAGTHSSRPGSYDKRVHTDRRTMARYIEERPGERLGRYPSNVVWTCVCEGPHLDGCPVGELDRQSGVRPIGGVVRDSSGKAHAFSRGGRSESLGNVRELGYDDSGTAARFFYVAKPSRAERDAGTNENTHPTVKGIELMRYLCRLITPPGGAILDPFMGSGSTGVAAAMEGFGFIGIEQEAEYFATAQRRIDHEARQLRMFS